MLCKLHQNIIRTAARLLRYCVSPTPCLLCIDAIMSKKDNANSCNQCVEMLKKVLTQNASRPRAVLEAMGSSCSFTPTTNGVVVSFQNQTERSTAVTTAIDNTNTVHESPPKETTKEYTTPSKVTIDAHRIPPISSPQPLAASVAQQAELKIECRPCSTQGPEGGARAFVMGPSPLSIVLCSNRLGRGGSSDDAAEMEEVLLHELVHVYDVKQLKLDLRDCVSLAYSEIRAAKFAECHDSYSWTQPLCVRLKATQATHNLFPKQAESCVSQAYPKAMNDVRPFSDEKKAGSSHGHSER